jgi:hypothetical protein
MAVRHLQQGCHRSYLGQRQSTYILQNERIRIVITSPYSRAGRDYLFSGRKTSVTRQKAEEAMKSDEFILNDIQLPFLPS